jgi:hypothetical protein
MSVKERQRAPEAPVVKYLVLDIYAFQPMLVPLPSVVGAATPRQSVSF